MRPLELSEDLLLVCEEVADEAVGVAFVLGQRGLDARAQDAVGKTVGEAGNEGFVSGGELNQTREVGSDCVEGCNISQGETAEGVLDNGQARFLVAVRAVCSIDSLDNFVFLRRYEGVWQFEEVQLQHASNDRDLVVCEDVLRNRFSIIDSVPQVVSSRKRHINKPDSPSRLITFKIGIIYRKL